MPPMRIAAVLLQTRDERRRWGLFIAVAMVDAPLLLVVVAGVGVAVMVVVVATVIDSGRG